MLALRVGPKGVVGMFDKSCPGSARIKSPVPEEFLCPNCGSSVEIWSHEFKATCDNCGRVVFRQKTPTCIQRCQYAIQCVGEKTYRELMEQAKEAQAQLQE